MDEKLISYIKSKKENFISDLKRLVDIKSVRETAKDGMPFGEGPAAVLKEAEKIASEHGFSVTNFDNYAGEIQLGENPDLMLLGHLDVVSEGDNWTREPYNMSVEGDRLYGRGTTDDKGAALACLYAVEAVRECYGEPDTGVRLVLGCGEETGSEDMTYYFSKREKLKYTLSPDADYPLINLEKGRFAPKFTRKCTSSAVVEINGGETANIVPGKANALVKNITADRINSLISEVAEKTGASYSVTQENGNVRINCTGVSAHAACPEKGNNANSALIVLLLSLDINDELTSALKDIYALIGHNDTNGKAMGVAMSDEKSGELSFNFGILKYDGSVLLCGLDLRCPLCADESNVKQVIKNNIENIGFNFVGDPKMRKVHYVPENAEIVKEALKVYEDYTGLKGECLAIGGGTYVHGIEGGVAFGIEFPGADYRIHGADEFAVADELLLTAQMYAQIIKDICMKG